jgi:hypothetical protein
MWRRKAGENKTENKVQNGLREIREGVKNLGDGAKLLGDGTKLLGDGIKGISNGIGLLLAGNIDISKLNSLDCTQLTYSFSASDDAVLNYSNLKADAKNPVKLEDLTVNFVELAPCKLVENTSWLQSWDVEVFDNIANAKKLITFYTKSYLVLTTLKISDVKRHVSTTVNVPVILANGLHTDANDLRLNFDSNDFARILGNTNNLKILNDSLSIGIIDNHIHTVKINSNGIVLTTLPKQL